MNKTRITIIQYCEGESQDSANAPQDAYTNGIWTTSLAISDASISVQTPTLRDSLLAHPSSLWSVLTHNGIFRFGNYFFTISSTSVVVSCTWFPHAGTFRSGHSASCISATCKTKSCTLSLTVPAGSPVFLLLFRITPWRIFSSLLGAVLIPSLLI